MRFKDAVVKCCELANKMSEHANTASRASRTYTATMELYNVAAEAGDEKAMQAHRDALHTCVDTILDSGAMVAALQNEINTVSASVTE
jgi:hypothetical protein